MAGTSTNSKIIQADKETVFNAFTDPKALAYWLAPYGMTGKVHDFDMRIGGGYEMSLYYKDSENKGKTAGQEDRFSATFIEINPNEKIVQKINFQSDNDQFKDEMTMEVQFEKLSTNSTRVTIIFRNIPTGIDPKDNEDGTEQSLQKLAKYLEGH